MSDQRVLISVVIPACNEELNLPACLESLRTLDCEVFVVDSGSTDRTVELAQAAGAQVVHHPFESFAQQFNWAIDNLPLRGDWVLRLDADEYLTPELREELGSVLPTLPADVTGLYLKRRMIFLGRWIRYGGYYPTWLLRLFRRGCARSRQAGINDYTVLTQGTARNLKHDFVDRNLRGVSNWLQKHERYAGGQAVFYEELRQGKEYDWFQPKLFGNQTARKQWLLLNFYKHAPLFFRAWIYFVYRYFFRLGFLDGRVGLIFHVLHGFWYPFYTDVKIYELRQKGNG